MELVVTSLSSKTCSSFSIHHRTTSMGIQPSEPIFHLHPACISSHPPHTYPYPIKEISDEKEEDQSRHIKKLRTSVSTRQHEEMVSMGRRRRIVIVKGKGKANKG